MNTSPDWRMLPLWEHQVRAIDTVLDYFRFCTKDNFGLLSYDKAALVRMPTGTGKSGIITILSTCERNIGRTLIICPWVALRSQLSRDIGYRFWERIGVENPHDLKEIYELVPSNSSEVIEKIVSTPSIVITTIQSLQRIYKDIPSNYNDLCHLINLVIVDEGHREPAPEWSKAVRDLHLPTVLFSATPYRNDHKLFNVDDRFTFVLSHNEAEKSKFIREVSFVEKRYTNREEFVNQLVDFYHGEFQSLKPNAIENPKVIIRCETNEEIIDIASKLRSRGETVLAVHERFSDLEEEDLVKSVPNTEEENADFWIHQNKLIEGIDDPRFCLLAIYSPFRNARALIQQIGRIIRNPKRTDHQIAFVFSNPTHRQQGYWKGYRKYEEIYNLNPDKFEPRVLFDSIIELQPIVQIGYLDKEFRERFDFEEHPGDGEIHLHLGYPRSTIVHLNRDGISLDLLLEGIQKEWLGLDLDIRKVEKPDENTGLLIYQICQNSPVLIHHALLEFRIGFTIIHKSGDFIFYYDSEGNGSLFVDKETEKVSPRKLENLFKGRNSRINQISLLNCDLGQHNIRRRVVHAYSIQETAPSLFDYSHFYSTAHGYTTRADNSYVRRYVGFTRSRVTDPSAVRIEYENYIKWLETIAEELERQDAPEVNLFNRFAKQIPPPSNADPLNILFDLDELFNDFVKLGETDEEEKETFQLDEKCYDILNGKFNCVINSETYEVTITYDKEKHRYHLRSPKLETSYTRLNPITNEKEEGLIAFINRNQAFRVITQNGIVYAHNYFYQPKLSLWGNNGDNNFDLRNVIYPTKALSTTKTEKGTKCQEDGSGWQEGSLFHYIDNIGQSGYLAEDEQFEILVCDDMNNELADFIAVSTEQKRVVLIHAKAHSRPTYTSASAFHDICSQATKNLGVISPFTTIIPPNLSLWNHSWKGTTTEGLVNQRIRRGSDSAENLWNCIKRILADPSSKKEVWLVIGQGFSLKRFENGQNKVPPDPEVVQILFLLQSTWSAISSIGAALRIYCSE